MNTNKNITIGALIVAVLIVGVLAFKQPTAIAVPTTIAIGDKSISIPPAVINIPAPIVNVSPAKVSVNVPTPIVQATKPTFGAQVGPESQSPFASWAGVQYDYASQALNTATSTPCQFRSPLNATSTLLFSSLRVAVATSTATVWTVAKSSVPFATTTILTPTFSLGSGAQGTFVIASSTTPGIDTVQTFAPGTYLVWSYQGSAFASSTLLTGVCKAEFLEN